MAVLDALPVSKPAGRSVGTPQRLVVAWQHPVKGKIHPVGFLTYDGTTYRFGYIRNAGRVEDFRPLLGFPDLMHAYSSANLFPLFAQRAMDPRRPDYQCYIERLGLDGEPGPWEQISRSQGRRQGDTLQLLPEPTLVDDTLGCSFLVNGMRHVPEEPRILDGEEVHATYEQIDAALASLQPGDDLALAREPDNPQNPLALMVTGASVPVGWVPDLLVEDVSNLLNRAKVSVTVAHVNGPDAPWHLRLLARLQAAPVADYRFFTGERWTPLADQPA
jgi:hypothetical protein